MAVVLAAALVLAVLVALQLRAFVAASRAGRVVWTEKHDGTTLTIVERRGWRELLLDDGARAMVHTRVSLGDSLVSGWPYTDGFHLAAALAGPPGRVLFVGGGGGIGPRQFLAFYPTATIDVVEVHDAVLRAARRFFGLKDEGRLRAHLDDGRAFLERCADASFDVIVLDAYEGAGYLAARLATQEFFTMVRAKLTPGGVCCLNLADDVQKPDTVVCAAAAGIQAAFAGECRFYDVPPAPDQTRSPRPNRLVLALRPPARARWEDLVAGAGTLDSRVPFARAIAAAPLDARPPCPPLHDRATN